MGRRAKTCEDMKDGEIADIHVDLNNVDCKHLQKIKNHLPTVGVDPSNKMAIKRALWFYSKAIDEGLSAE